MPLAVHAAGLASLGGPPFRCVLSYLIVRDVLALSKCSKAVLPIMDYTGSLCPLVLVARIRRILIGAEWAIPDEAHAFERLEESDKWTSFPANPLLHLGGRHTHYLNDFRPENDSEDDDDEGNDDVWVF
ncbi:hypothetical protein HDU89_001184 [Geranomyces variabilis]|nr:hypothetical protein HDU89_001184 [Geranomyces variabilis]